jgi:uncharacterized membrane protein YsdA (DUF1294 family)
VYLKLAENEVVDKIFSGILTPILAVIKWLVGTIFSSRAMLIIFFIIMINLIAILLMKKDKEYAEKGERRIREATLLLVALMGGSFGMYFAMFKYKHKTLHRKFSIGVPVIIMLQFAYMAYAVMRGILA